MAYQDVHQHAYSTLTDKNARIDNSLKHRNRVLNMRYLNRHL